jgi:hypothetical protein
VFRGGDFGANLRHQFNLRCPDNTLARFNAAAR